MADERQAAILAAAAQVVDALEFYADPDNYFALMIVPDHPCGAFAYDTAPLVGNDADYYTDYRDGHAYHGKRAREALAAWRKAVIGEE